jgi:hypothetical protein
MEIAHDNNNDTITIGDVVKHRFRNYPNGTIEKIASGCNAVIWVDFGETVCNQKHLTICSKIDIIKV